MIAGVDICRQVKCMSGKDHKRTLVKQGMRHSCRIDETIQLQVNPSPQQAGMRAASTVCSFQHVSYTCIACGLCFMEQAAVHVRVNWLLALPFSVTGICTRQSLLQCDCRRP